jgi:hypothetical protein
MGEKMNSTTFWGCDSVTSQNIPLFTVTAARSSNLSLAKSISDWNQTQSQTSPLLWVHTGSVYSKWVHYGIAWINMHLIHTALSHIFSSSDTLTPIIIIKIIQAFQLHTCFSLHGWGKTSYVYTSRNFMEILPCKQPLDDLNTEGRIILKL